MSDHETASSDGLQRWLLGGLATGGAMLGLLIAAYAIGYHRGRDHGRTAATTAPAAATTTTAAPANAVGPVTPTPALVARGKTLYSTDGCAACHSLSGSAGVGPSLNGIAGTNVALATGRTVLADDAYLEQSISNPDVAIAKGYRAGVMSAAVSSFGLPGKPNDVRALVAFIKSQR